MIYGYSIYVVLVFPSMQGLDVVAPYGGLIPPPPFLHLKVNLKIINEWGIKRITLQKKKKRPIRHEKEK